MDSAEAVAPEYGSFKADNEERRQQLAQMTARVGAGSMELA